MSVSDMEDPFMVDTDALSDEELFATEEDLKSGGGGWNPRPSSVEDMAEMLLVIVPRKFEKEAKVSEYLQKKYNMKPFREQWTVDIIVLDGPKPWSFEYTVKENRDSDVYVQKTHTVESYPYMMTDTRITWANIIGAVNKIQASPKPMGVGRIRGGYTAAEMRKGKTFEDFAAELKAWEETVKTSGIKAAGEQPKAKWHFVPTSAPEDMKKAIAWWAVAKKEGFQL